MRKLHIPAGISEHEINELLPRATDSGSTVLSAAMEIIEDVKLNGLTALQEQARKFDGVRDHELRVSFETLSSVALDEPLSRGVSLAITRVRQVSLANRPKDVDVQVTSGGQVSTRFLPVDSVGVYVPGGKAVYPSSVIMNVVPAQVAGVKRIALASPPQSDGKPHPTILATAKLLGIEEVYAIGGAGAIAAFAFGVPEIDLEPVRMVTGPGNAFVAAAKGALRGVIGIDSEAGPTEILILADASADPDLVVADLISQAEHDENAAAILVTDSERLADEVLSLLPKAIALTENRQRVEAALSGIQSAVVVTPDWENAIFIANAYATEHLEIISRDPAADLKRITNAGAVFLGPGSPVSLGDYLAGSNHVLPTGQQAKFGPGLGVHTFLRPQQVINFSTSALAEVTDLLEVFSAAEGLPAHGAAARVRSQKES